MWAVGDPHIRHMDAEAFSVCDAPGLQEYFVSEEKFRVELLGQNTVANEDTGSNATIITKVYDLST